MKKFYGTHLVKSSYMKDDNVLGIFQKFLNLCYAFGQGVYFDDSVNKPEFFFQAGIWRNKEYEEV